MFLLKGVRPEKYRERVEVRGTLASIDLNRSTDEQLAWISAGEPPWFVLGTPDGPTPALLPAQEDREP